MPNPPEATLGKKRDAELPAIDDPDYALPVYQGENKKRQAAMKKAKGSPMVEAMKRRLDAENVKG